MGKPDAAFLVVDRWPLFAGQKPSSIAQMDGTRRCAGSKPSMESYLLIPLFGGLLNVLGAWLWLVVRVSARCRVGPRQLDSCRQLAFGSPCVIHKRRSKPSSCWWSAIGVGRPGLYLLVVPADLRLRETSQGSRLRSLMSTALRSDTVHAWMESQAFYLQLGGLIVAALPGSG